MTLDEQHRVDTIRQRINEITEAIRSNLPPCLIHFWFINSIKKPDNDYMEVISSKKMAGDINHMTDYEVLDLGEMCYAVVHLEIDMTGYDEDDLEDKIEKGLKKIYDGDLPKPKKFPEAAENTMLYLGFEMLKFKCCSNQC